MTIPLGRESSLGNNPLWVQRARVRLAGNGASRTCSIVVGSGTSANFSVAAAGQAADVGFRDLDYKYSQTSAASISVGYNTSGSVFLGRWGGTAPGTDSVWGQVFYVQVPSPPSSVGAQAPSPNTIRVSWSAPADDGDSSVLGYVVEISTSSNFSSGTLSHTASGAGSHDFTGLTAGSSYFARVFAFNDVRNNFSNSPMSRQQATTTAVTVTAPPSPVWITDPTLSGVNVSTAYSLQLSASNTTSYSKLPGGTNDSWVIVSSSGEITGTSPSTSQTASFTVRASGGGSPPAERTFTILVSGPAPSWISTSPLQSVNVSSAYSVQLSASNSPSYQKLPGGTNDGWIGVSSTGVVGGVSPSTPQTSTFTVRASANGIDVDRQFSISVQQPAPDWITGTSLPAGQQNVAYSTSISASNTSFYSKVSGDAWIIVDSNGNIRGTPPTSGTASFTARATGPTGLTTDRTFTISVASAPVPVWVTASPLASVVIGTPYSVSVSATNAASYSKLSGGTNDSWVTVSSIGQISGTPDVVGNTIVKVRATSSLGMTSDKDFQITVTAPLPVWTTPINLIGGKKGVAYSATVSATNANNYSISGAAPSWLSLNSTTGQITGTPNTDGDFSVTIIPSGLGGSGPSRTFLITIASASPVWLDDQLQNSSGTLNVAYSDGFAASNVVASNGYLITGLPNGLGYNSSTGAITGTPTQTGVFTVRATALGQDGTSINATATLSIFYPGRRFAADGSPARISDVRRFNGTSWVGAQFVRRFNGTSWVDASN